MSLATVSLQVFNCINGIKAHTSVRGLVAGLVTEAAFGIIGGIYGEKGTNALLNVFKW